MTKEYRPNDTMVWLAVFVGPHLFALQPFDFACTNSCGDQSERLLVENANAPFWP
ncbi:MAG: hypothetical protein IPJ48_17530 [Propionivibrio sp.]|uniref:Uncharacterized protein n=1 Tax=Candidatus Propionivibrio dominans TaxID=2954373 RepID=A0A9D7F9V7_9RHOO|nr:hypothetical protein [Candidatus Propionivibrio dominans]